MALRLLTTFDFFEKLPGYKEFATWWETAQGDLGIKMQSVEEVLTNARKDIGDCAGGFYRHITNDEQMAFTFSWAVKMFLIILPCLNAFQWLQRAISGAKGTHIIY